MKHVVVWILIPLAAAAGFTWYFVYAANPLTGFWQSAYAHHHAAQLHRFPHQPGRYTLTLSGKGSEQFSTRVFHSTSTSAPHPFPADARMVVIFQEKWSFHGHARVGTYEIVLGKSNNVLEAKRSGSFSRP